MIVSVPSSARGFEPVTGASTKPMPCSASRAAIDLTALGAIVLMSTTRPPSAKPSAAPSSPKRTASTWGESTTIVTTMSAPCAAVRGVSAIGSPSSSARARVRFQTTTSKPAARRLRAIREPMIPSPRKAIRSAMPASSWGFDTESVTWSQATRGLRREFVAVQRVPAGRPVATAGGARWRGAGALGDQREAHVRERLEFAHDAVAATLGSIPAGAATDRVLDRPQRELALERFDRRVERIAHRDVHGARAGGVLTRALSAAKRLVVGEVVVAGREVVHGPLAQGAAERGQHQVGYARRGLDVAGGHRGGWARVEQRSLRGDHRHRAIGAGARRHVRIGEDAHGEIAGGGGHGERAV